LANLTCTEGQTFVFTITNGSTFCNAITLQATVIAEGLISENGFFWLADTSGFNVRLFQRNGLTDTANQAGSCQLCSSFIPTPSPTTQPTPQPTPQPTTQPTPQPTPQPTTSPTFQPTTQPTPSPTSPSCFAIEISNGRNAFDACCFNPPTTAYFSTSTIGFGTIYYGNASDCSTVGGIRYFNQGGTVWFWDGSSMSSPGGCEPCP
jgi:hypothetical protein